MTFLTLSLPKSQIVTFCTVYHSFFRVLILRIWCGHWFLFSGSLQSFSFMEAFRSCAPKISETSVIRHQVILLRVQLRSFSLIQSTFQLSVSESKLCNRKSEYFEQKLFNQSVFFSFCKWIDWITMLTREI